MPSGPSTPQHPQRATGGCAERLNRAEVATRARFVPQDVAANLANLPCEVAYVCFCWVESAERRTGAVCFYRQVPDEIILERIVGRRQDPVTGDIYHLTYAPPKTEEVAQRLTQRSDDTEEACRTRLRVHHENVGIVRDAYVDVLQQVRARLLPLARASRSVSVLSLSRRGLAPPWVFGCCVVSAGVSGAGFLISFFVMGQC